MLFNASATFDEGLTSAQKLGGFSGSYGLGGGLGGLTLNDIAYDLSTSFTEACQQVGIKLGLPTPIKETLIPIELDKGLPKVDLLSLDQLQIETPLQSYFDKDSEFSIDSESLGPNIPDIKLISEPTKLTNMINGYSLLSLSTGDRLTSKLTSDLPFVTSKYRIQNGGKHIVSGYSSHIIHSGKSSGKSHVTFTQLHTLKDTPKMVSVPELIQPTIDWQSFDNGLSSSLTPFSYLYPTDYERELKKSSDSKIDGFGSLLTGSYGSVLNNGYRTVHLLSEGGLKGLKLSLTKK